METLELLFEKRYGCRPEQVTQITGSASPRHYYRLSAGGVSCMGVIGTDKAENETFVALSGISSRWESLCRRSMI